MNKVVIIIIAVTVVAAAAFLIMNMVSAVDVSAYERLKDPVITTIPDTKVVQVQFEVPSKGLAEVFKVLFKSYYSTQGVPKGKNMQPPSVRYFNTIDFDMAANDREKMVGEVVWKGAAAIPVSQKIREVNSGKGTGGLKAELGEWKYGEVAEILHIGPYEKEAPTVNRLLQFVEDSGYDIAGPHEEVYLIGPGNPLIKPEKYYTVIRYQIKKKDK